MKQGPIPNDTPLLMSGQNPATESPALSNLRPEEVATHQAKKRKQTRAITQNKTNLTTNLL
jgi:hypothetical protein